MGEKARVEAAETPVEVGAYHQSRACGPENRDDRVILAAVGLDSREDAAAAIWIAVAVDETARCAGIFKLVLTVVA